MAQLDDHLVQAREPFSLSFRMLVLDSREPIPISNEAPPTYPRHDITGSDGASASSPALPPPVQDNEPTESSTVAPRPCIPDVMDVYGEYVYNEVPTHLIYVPERRVISRDQLRRLYREDIESITEADVDDSLKLLQREPWRIQDPLSGTRNLVDPQRKDAIRNLIINKLSYTIFSHRWLADEPTFQDMSSPDHEQRLTSIPGYRKLLQFLDKTTAFGHVLAWSDTCCIDKTSSAELEEAIRSMFQWYRHARICIAYLASSSSLSDFPGEPWFTRGWTLQELLAPQIIKFYGRDWVPLGDVGVESDKDDPAMLKAISDVTSIPESQLLSFTPGTHHVYMKMKWASTRRTTKIEDAAYCLLGIFDLSIPVAYGEGRWAFHRLMEALMLRCNEWQIFAWAGPCSTYSDFIPASPHCYGRDALGIDNINSAWCVPPVGDKGFRVEQPGLRLKLFIVKTVGVEFANSAHWNGEIMAGLEYPSLTLERTVRVRHHLPLDLFRGLSHQLAVGILNYENVVDEGGLRSAGEGQLYGSCLYLGLLLQHGLVNGLGKTATKHMTEDLVVVRCRTDTRGRLTTVYV